MERDAGKCNTCARESYFYSVYLKQGLCKKHFEKMLIRRARSALISKGYKQRKFKISDDSSAGSKMVNFIFRKDAKSSLLLKNAVLEDFSVAVLRYFLTGDKPKYKIGSKTFFNPLYLISEEELEAFLKAKEIKYVKKEFRGKDLYILNFIRDVEKRRPGGMISLVKMGERIGII